MNSSTCKCHRLCGKMDGLGADSYWLKTCLLLFLLAAYNEGGLPTTEAACVPETGCNYALAFYTIQRNDTVSALSQRFQFQTETLQSYNRNLTNINLIFAGQNIFIPFRCSCTNGQLTHNFQYTVVTGDTVGGIVNGTYEKLSTESAVANASTLANVNLITVGESLSIPVQCYCGDPSVNSSYGLFTTYVVHSGDQLSALASNFSVDADLITKYNPGISALQADQIIFIPARDGTGAFPPFTGSTANSTGANSNKSNNTGLIVGVIVGALVLVAAAFLGFYFGWKYISKHNSADEHEKQPYLAPHPTSSSRRRLGSSDASMSVSTVLAELRSIEFSYEELAAATHNFDLSHKIGQGGFASVYFGLINGQKLAIKKMTLKADKEFMAELKILSNVHHTNLVQLIGYCTTNSLFLVYEYVENGTLDQRLHCLNIDGMEPLTWSQRYQISLDAARGLEYIHEHTKPTYVHRDIKPANILIDNNFHAKVADFGLTKLTEDQTGTGGVVGTFGYMSPEYALYGEVSSKVDVYAFGVVLFEIISGKAAISPAETAASPQPLEDRTLVHLVDYCFQTYSFIDVLIPTALFFRTRTFKFSQVLEDPDGRAYLDKYVDPALNGDYPADSMWKIAQLARRCTRPTPDMRPTMRSAVLQLMTLASDSQEWEVNYLGRN